MLINEVRNILEKRAGLNEEDDYGIEQCRDKLIQKLSIQKEETILIINQLTADEIILVSEVFEEISYNLQSKEYIQCLRELETKYSHLDLKGCIDVAEDFMK